MTEWKDVTVEHFPQTCLKILEKNSVQVKLQYINLSSNKETEMPFLKVNSWQLVNSELSYSSK